MASCASSLHSLEVIGGHDVEADRYGRGPASIQGLSDTPPLTRTADDDGGGGDDDGDQPLLGGKGVDRRSYWGYLGTFSVLVGLILGVVGLSLEWFENRDFPVVVGGWFAVQAILLSAFQIMEHLSAFSQPDVQSRMIRILLMVPLYATTSWFAMTFPDAAEYLDLVRDMYEAYALYTFFSLMMGLMGGTDAVVRNMMSGGAGSEELAHPFPFCSRRFSFNTTCLHRIRVSLLQFMVLKPLCAVVIIVLAASDRYGDSFSDFKRGYIYLTVVYNVSITVALYGLMYFYIGAHDLLSEHKPFYKFLAIKGVVFLSYWQSLGIAILHASGALPRIRFWDEDQQATGLQDFLICCEMLLFAICHKVVFSVPQNAELIQLPALRRSAWSNLLFTLRHEDVRDDFRDAWAWRDF